jgi:hypothetical protein
MSLQVPTIEDKIRTASQLKAEGNALFTTGDYAKALSKYTKVCCGTLNVFLS